MNSNPAFHKQYASATSRSIVFKLAAPLQRPTPLVFYSSAHPIPCVFTTHKLQRNPLHPGFSVFKCVGTHPKQLHNRRTFLPTAFTAFSPPVGEAAGCG